jgi:hypothetical protein
MAMRYSVQRGLNISTQAYLWQENTYKWMVASLYSQMRAKCLRESELRGKCRIELSKMAKRIKSGESIPAPIVQIEKVVVPVSLEKALEHIGQIKALIKINYTKH